MNTQSTSSVPENRLRGDLSALEEFASDLAVTPQALSRRVNADRDDVERGLAQLVLTVIELLRKLLEEQAIRRIEGGSLSDEQIEHMGDTFQRLAVRMDELKALFGLTDDDLNLNLGPLGDLM